MSSEKGRLLSADRSSVGSDSEAKSAEIFPNFGELHPGENYKLMIDGCARVLRFRPDALGIQTGSVLVSNYRLRFVPRPCRCKTADELGPPKWHSGVGCEMKGPITPWGGFIHSWPLPAEELDAILTTEELAGSKLNNSASVTPVPQKDGHKHNTETSTPLTAATSYDIPLYAIKRASLLGRELKLLCRDGRCVDIELSSESENEALMRILGSFAFPLDDVSSAFAFQTRYRVGLGWDIFDYDLDMARTLVNRASRTRFVKRESMCETYPQYVFVPEEATTDDIIGSGAFRSMKRIPVAVWAHPKNGSVLVRSAQPLIGLLGNRSAFDEKLVKLTCGTQYLLLDARSRAAALGNRAMGKGTESIERGYDGATELVFCDLGNIHHLKASASNLIKVLTEYGPANSWSSAATLSDLSVSLYNSPEVGTWLTNVSQLLRASLRIVEAMDSGQVTACWTHCSDGWDRTGQMCALAQLLMDPEYRTRIGFAALVEKNFALFGFKFRERSRGIPRPNSASNPIIRSGSPSGPVITIPTVYAEQVLENEEDESSPVLLLFLDCVYQILTQFPDRFDFNEKFLIAIADAYYSGRFGTFLCNTQKERLESKVSLETRSVWDWICFDDQFKNTNKKFVPYAGILLANSSIRVMKLFETYWGRFDAHQSNFRPMRNCFF